eukprot:SAG31_NODE_8406_length_1458_cov_0.988962_1_plen_158_part_10
MQVALRTLRKADGDVNAAAQLLLDPGPAAAASGTSTGADPARLERVSTQELERMSSSERVQIAMALSESDLASPRQQATETLTPSHTTSHPAAAMHGNCLHTIEKNIEKLRERTEILWDEYHGANYAEANALKCDRAAQETATQALERQQQSMVALEN